MSDSKTKSPEMPITANVQPSQSRRAFFSGAVGGVAATMVGSSIAKAANAPVTDWENEREFTISGLVEMTKSAICSHINAERYTLIKDQALQDDYRLKAYKKIDFIHNKLKQDYLSDSMDKDFFRALEDLNDEYHHADTKTLAKMLCVSEKEAEESTRKLMENKDYIIEAIKHAIRQNIYYAKEGGKHR